MLAILSRWILVASQCSTLALTWPLWTTRDRIPAVSHLSLPDLDAGPLILASLALVLLPDVLRLLRRGAPSWLLPVAVLLHLATLGAAMVQDELRVQPQVLVPAALLLSTLRAPGARWFGLGVLAAMWTWAGLHKLISDRYVEVFGAAVISRLFPDLGPGAVKAAALGIAASELALGLAVLTLPFDRHRWLRWSLVLAGIGLHVGIVISLLQLGHNPSVWPWNLAVAVCCVALLSPGGESFVKEMRRARAFTRAAVVAILVAPAGFYLGITHPYLAFVLYSNNAPRAHVRTVEMRPLGSPGPRMREIQVPLRYMEELRSFVPPTARNYYTVFAALWKPGETLIIEDDRAWARRAGRARIEVPYGGALPE